MWQPRIAHVVMQTTPFCNIDCKYCYLPDRRNRVRMDAGLVRRLAERVVDCQDAGEPVKWYWHAGEPLTVGLEHFTACHDAVAAGAPLLADTFRYHVQTNGILVDAAWAAFFHKHTYGVGVSLDGPADIHDANRVTRSGAGTFDKVVDGIKRLQDAGVRPGVLAVVTEASLDRPLDILEAYAALGVDSVAFNFEEIEGSHAVSSLRTLDTEGLLRGKVEHFIGTILRERDAKYPRIKLRETDWMLPSILSGDAVEDWLTRPMTYLTVLADGRVSSFCPELAGQVGEDKGFPVCQVQDEDFVSFADRIEKSAAYAAIRTGVDDCRVSCEYFELCGGGCPSNKFFETGNFAATETLYCRIRNQYVTDAVLDYIIEQGHAPAGAPIGTP